MIRYVVYGEQGGRLAGRGWEAGEAMNRGSVGRGGGGGCPEGSLHAAELM